MKDKIQSVAVCKIIRSVREIYSTLHQVTIPNVGGGGYSFWGLGVGFGYLCILLCDKIVKPNEFVKYARHDECSVSPGNPKPKAEGCPVNNCSSYVTFRITHEL